ncbi:MAG TPA: LysR substrate-binding domain-containing protein [Alicycliphilus sp.]|nr:LysR substrate-binding domain-containing protein [Alicycliphilus sp.]
MSNHIPVVLLRSFEAAARTRSITQAAAELFLTPSAVSHAVRKLEVQLGTSLFQREGRSLQLTPDGEALMLYVGRGFDDLRRGIEAISGSTPGRLRLHCAPSFAAQWLAPRLPSFIAQYPGIELHLSSDTDYLRFQNHEFDADIVFDFRPTGGLCALPLGNEIIAPLCSPELAQRIGTPADLLQLPLLDSYNRQVRWLQWFLGNGIPSPTIRGLSFDRNFLCIRAAVDGLGVALESTLLAQREIAEGKLVAPLAGKTVDIDTSNHALVFPMTPTTKRPLRCFIGWLSSELNIDLSRHIA